MPMRRAWVLLGVVGACAVHAAGQGEGRGEPDLSPEAIRSVTERYRTHGVAEAPAKTDGSVRIATYNIHDLYDDADDPDLSGRRDDATRAMTPGRRLATGLALRAIDADIVALQEVESSEALDWYRGSALEGMGYAYAASEDVGHSVGMEQAVLSRFPILATRTWPDLVIGEHPELYRGRPNRYAGQPMTFRRSPLMVEIGLVDERDESKLGVIPETQRLTLLVVHAKTGEGSEAWRAAEGEALAEIVAELRQGRADRRVVVLGDFASPPGEGHLSPLFEAGFGDAFAGLVSADEHDPKTTATGLDGARSCLVLLGDGEEAVAPPFVLGTLATPEGLDQRMVYGLPGFASDHYPVVCDLAR